MQRMRYARPSLRVFGLGATPLRLSDMYQSNNMNTKEDRWRKSKIPRQRRKLPVRGSLPDVILHYSPSRLVPEARFYKPS